MRSSSFHPASISIVLASASTFFPWKSSPEARPHAFVPGRYGDRYGKVGHYRRAKDRTAARTAGRTGVVGSPGTGAAPRAGLRDTALALLFPSRLGLAGMGRSGAAAQAGPQP